MSIFDAIVEKGSNLSKTTGHALSLAPDGQEIAQMLHWAKAGNRCDLQSISLAVTSPAKTWTFIKKHFRAIKAAGGIVEKKSHILLIYKRDRWDLPKGKSKPYERAKATAMREIQEECGVRAQAMSKIGVTHHVLPLKNGKYGLKTTKWYRMRLTDDAQMRPQEEEGIEQVAWFEPKEAVKNLESSYLSVNHVIQLWQLCLACSNAALAPN